MTIHQRYRQTDRRHAIPRPRICTKVHCAVKNWKFHKLPEILAENSVIPGNSRWEFLTWQIPGNSREFTNGNSRWPWLQLVSRISKCRLVVRLTGTSGRRRQSVLTLVPFLLTRHSAFHPKSSTERSSCRHSAVSAFRPKWFRHSVRSAFRPKVGTKNWNMFVYIPGGYCKQV